MISNFDKNDEITLVNIYTFYTIYKIPIEEIAAMYKINVDELKEIIAPYENLEYVVTQRDRNSFCIY
jgi:hypothetical protein